MERLIYSKSQYLFPSFINDFIPYHHLILKYTLNLFHKSPIHEDLLLIAFNYIGFSKAKSIISDIFMDENKLTELDDFTKIDNIEDLAKISIKYLINANTIKNEKELRRDFNIELELIYSKDIELPEFNKRVQYFMINFKLDEIDNDILLFILCLKIKGSLKSYFDNFGWKDDTSVISHALNYPYEIIKEKLSGSSPLIQMEFINFNKGIFLDDEIASYLIGRSSLIFKEFTKLPSSQYDLHSFPLSDDQRMILDLLMQSSNPFHILLYGAPGTGKTELAKTLATISNRKCYQVCYGSSGENKDRRQSIIRSLSLLPVESILVIDEADSFLNHSLFGSDNVEKGWINNLLDNCKHKIIWISNTIKNVDLSVLRRYTYNVEFKQFNNKQKYQVLESQLKSYGLTHFIDNNKIEILSRDYAVNAGQISSAIKAVSSIYQSAQINNSDNFTNTIREFLSSHEKLSERENSILKQTKISSQYDLTTVHTDYSLQMLLKALKEQRTSRISELPLNILFWGVPGSGKTEFVKYLSKSLNMELLIKRMSQLQSKYVGETEKNIAQAFKEAANQDKVLFLDEADSLFINRTSAVRSWEISQTNEILNQMENFEGICICCTNLLENLDSAAIRRFTWKIKFLPLTEEGKIILFRKYFQPKGRISTEVKRRLLAIQNLTHGDFRNVWQKTLYTSEISGSDTIITELKNESDLKNQNSLHPIGFV